MRPFYGGALWGLKSLGKIQQVCDEEQWRREPRQKETLWLRSVCMPTQTQAQSNQTKTAIEVLAGAQTKNIPRPRQGKRLTDQVNLQTDVSLNASWHLYTVRESCVFLCCLVADWNTNAAKIKSLEGCFLNNNNNTKRNKRKSKCATKATWLEEIKVIGLEKSRWVSESLLMDRAWLSFVFLPASIPSQTFKLISTHQKKSILQSGMGLNFTKESSNQRRCIWGHQWNIVA